MNHICLSNAARTLTGRDNDLGIRRSIRYARILRDGLDDRAHNTIREIAAAQRLRAGGDVSVRAVGRDAHHRAPAAHLDARTSPAPSFVRSFVHRIDRLIAIVSVYLVRFACSSTSRRSKARCVMLSSSQKFV